MLYKSPDGGIKSKCAKILVISPAPAQQFVKNDVRVLRQWYNVSLIEGPRNGNLIKLSSYLRKTDVVLCWFGCRMAAYAVLLAKLLQKKVIVIAGGQDVANIPEIGHGMMGKWQHRGFIKYAFKNCNASVAVSKFTVHELLKWVSPKALCMIYNGVAVPPDEVSFECREGVLCTTRIAQETIKLKGIETLFKAARLLPDIPFTIVGEVSMQFQQFLGSIAPQNVKITGKLDHDSVLRLCASHKVYIQPSYYESFGVGLDEAMASGCVPVVTGRGALPEVVGNAGFYVEYGDAAALAEAVRMALCSDLSSKAVQRIRDFFTLEQRGETLKKLINGLLDNNAVPQDLLFDRNNLVQTINE